MKSRGASDDKIQIPGGRLRRDRRVRARRRLPRFAQSKTLKIIVPYTPGSGPDIISRLMGEQIGKAGGPTVVVENRPGGGMTIGTEAAARAEPDGNTVLLVANAFVVNMAVKRGNFTLANFEPVCNLASTPMPLVVQSSAPWKTVQELVADAKANPGQDHLRQRRTGDLAACRHRGAAASPPRSTSTTCPMAAPRPRSTR